ncbi:MAG: basic amino acid ABC transporter substrate-binding protein [Clostridiaceae bacterium]|jgi:polar amino acid transport system substrate-binding protein|nr:basic amino acid ABC transporter substrate-binding protein [Clostridiaceae bacterium]
MKALKRIAPILLTGVLLLAFTACSGGGDKQLVMATNAAFPPYEYYENEKIVGIDAEIAEAIAKKLDMELKIEDMEFGSIITAVQTGKVDMGMAGMTITEDRLISVNFSTPYTTASQVIIVTEDSDITSVDDLADKSIGVQESTTGDIYISDEFPEADVQRYSKGVEAVQALIQGKVSAVVIDSEPAKVFVNQNEGLNILPEAYTTEEYAIAVSKKNGALLDKLNTALAELTEDGTIQRIIDKYISAD